MLPHSLRPSRRLHLSRPQMMAATVVPLGCRADLAAARQALAEAKSISDLLRVTDAAAKIAKHCVALSQSAARKV